MSNLRNIHVALSILGVKGHYDVKWNVHPAHFIVSWQVTDQTRRAKFST